MLSQRDIENYLERIRQIRGAHELIDIHVHPFEVIFNALKYRQHPQCEGVYSSAEADYRPPHVSVQEQSSSFSDRCVPVLNEEMKARCLLLAMRQRYLHTGPRVIADQMNLSGIDKVLLLPVMAESAATEEQMEIMAGMFGRDPRFSYGYSIPNTVGNAQICTAVSAAVRKFAVKALKVHPAVTGLNLGTTEGCERIECMLEACREHGLSVIIHGGRSPAAANAGYREFGTLEKLQRIDWSRSGYPVVIAHAGLYGYETEEFLPEITDRLTNIMDKHDNVFADISGIELPTLCSLLKLTDTARLVFGSDCLYYPQWKILIGLYHALCKVFTAPDEQFVRIASTNPLKIINSAGSQPRLRGSQEELGDDRKVVGSAGV